MFHQGFYNGFTILSYDILILQLYTSMLHYEYNQYRQVTRLCRWFTAMFSLHFVFLSIFYWFLFIPHNVTTAVIFHVKWAPVWEFYIKTNYTFFKFIFNFNQTILWPGAEIYKLKSTCSLLTNNAALWLINILTE